MYLRRRVALIIERKGKFLLALHAFNFRFGLIGGGVKFGEKLEETVRREVREELSCKTARIKKLFFVDSWFQRHEVFSVRLVGKTKTNWEIRKLKWVSRFEILVEHLNPSSREIFEKLLKP